MKWPWVDRLTLDEECAFRRLAETERDNAIALANELRSALVKAMDVAMADRERTDRLIQTLVDLKREGFVPPVRHEDLDLVTANVPDGILEAIESRVPGDNPGLRRQMLGWAQKQMAHPDADAKLVADAIYKGGDFEEEE